MSLPLEDLFNDVISKTQRGLRLDDDQLAAQAGVSVEALRAAKNGDMDDTVLSALAAPLKLHGPSLIAMAHNAWRPADVQLDGLAQFNTTWHDMTVNAYLVWDAQTKNAIAFDTGATAQPMLDFLRANGLTLRLLSITHTHPDHIADIASLNAEKVLVNERETVPGAETFQVGTTGAWGFDGLKIEARNTYGHSKGGTTFVVTGLAQPVAVVGDALFASSMGGGMVSFSDALSTNRSEIFTLPDNTIVCPGHGPLTTVGEEKAHNPFYPEFKA
jgi:glyoxylase-like metal-dependent hydrolase (beta-lactamase superfamily II)